jgi:hypothetical protein
MSKSDLQSEKLDRAAKNLFARRGVNNAEIENIVEAPELFTSIARAIAAEKRSRCEPPRLWNRFAVISLLQTNKMTSVSALLLVIASGTVFIAYHSNQFSGAENARRNVEKPLSPPIFDRNQTESAAETTIGATLTETRRATTGAVKNRAAADSQTVSRRRTAVPNRPRQTPRVAAPPKTGNVAPEVFYSLAGAENWENEGEDLRLVRAELSKSELFALGFDMPIEPESPKIKTDLLIGTNGVARAIRFVE